MKLGRKTVDICVFIFLVTFIGCGDNDSGSVYPEKQTTDATLTGQQLADTVVDQWIDVDFSLANPNGYTDTDLDGQIDTNDAVNLIESAKFLGYDIPETIIDGLYNNYYTANGYDEILGTSAKINFSYTVDSPVTEADLKALDWSGLEVGDLIFTDFDKNFEWDNVAVYLGASSGYTHAVVYASDFHDKVVIENLDDDTTPVFLLDIEFGYCDVRTPDYETISNY